MSLKEIAKAEKKIQKEIHKDERRFVIVVITGVVLLIGLCVAACFSSSSLPILKGEYVPIHVCDYCDASHWHLIKFVGCLGPFPIILHNSDGEEARRLCTDCYIKVFDTVLGDSIYKKDKEEK